jgi:hypothetical protein
MAKLNQLWTIFIKRLKFQQNGCRFMSKTPEDDGADTSDTKLKKKKNLKKDSDIKSPSKKALSIIDIPEPTNCCMSGCVNCVWIEYAEKLSSILKHSPNDIQKIILEKVQDPNMRAFLISELKVRKTLK